jgi:hypothetical protein
MREGRRSLSGRWYEQPFYVLDLEAGLARALVELDPRHTLVR